MIYYLTTIKDSIGNNYLGVDIQKGVVDPFLKELNDILGNDDFLEYTTLQKNRDRDHYHITVINSMEYNKLSNEIGMGKFVNSLESKFKYGIEDLKLMGIGKAERNENRSYFVVCKSESLDTIRSSYDLPEQDFHITLGFLYKDVFGVRKNEVMKKESKFTKLLKQEFYKKENFNFIKQLPNFNMSNDSEIVPISISDEFIKVMYEDTVMDIGINDENKLSISTRYKKTSTYNRLPMTEVYKILN